MHVTYWEEFKHLLTWAHENVASTLYSCWSAHAALKIFYDINREQQTNPDGTPQKVTGLFSHALKDQFVSLLTMGLPDVVICPHSHWSGIPRNAVAKEPELKILLENPEAGILLLEGRKGREVYLQGHPEYAADALRKEFERDRSPERFGKNAPLPKNYFLGGGQGFSPNMWRSNAVVLFHNWINLVYQTTHFDLREPLMD